MTGGIRAPTRAPISGLGPHGEFPGSVEALELTDAAARTARQRNFSVAVVLHTIDSDWSRLQIAGIRQTLETYGAEISHLMSYRFRADLQVAALEELADSPPDAVISIPIDGSVRVSEAHRALRRAGCRVVLMDNAPAGVVAGDDYAGLVSADSFGNGIAAAEILAAGLPDAGSACVVGYGLDFPVTNERELGFRRWMRDHRSDVVIDRVEFGHPSDAGEVVAKRLAAGPPDGFFVVWDDPALLAIQSIRDAGLALPVTTIDLSMGIALEIADGGLIRGVGAQLPFDQGEAEALVALMSLTGSEPPPWVALPSLRVTRAEVLEAFEAVNHAPAPSELRRALGRP